ncbi:hypothetical protein D9M70_622220 [compost metagenome]
MAAVIDQQDLGVILRQLRDPPGVGGRAEFVLPAVDRQDRAVQPLHLGLQIPAGERWR